MALTRIQLIDHVLNQSQLDSSYRDLARTWLNIVRTKFATDTKFKIWRKQATLVPFVAGQQTYDLPTDFLNFDQAFVIDANGTQGSQIYSYDSYEFDPASSQASGDPSFLTIDEDNRKIIFNSVPETGKSYKLYYYYSPVAYSTDSTDDNVIPDFPNQNLLIQEMIVLAYENRDDERYPMKVAEAEKANVKHQRNLSQNIGTGVMQLSQASFRPRRRRV